MTRILMILTVYVTEQGVLSPWNLYFCATKVWKHRQDTKYI